jgi:flagellar assembly protein FliH
MTAAKPRPVPAPADSGRAAPRDLYSRFIPREELSSFASWSFGDVSGVAATGATGAAAREPEAPSDPAELLAQQLRAARQTGYQDGYRDGLVALDAFKQSFSAQITTQIGTLMNSLAAELGGLQQDMARTLAISATHLARQIVRSELTIRPELIAQVAHEAVDTLLLSAQHITLRVHPDDHTFVAQGAADVLAARGTRLLSDPAMSRGGCLVESDIGVIDASLETRWRRAAASLGCDEGWAGEPPPETEE